MINRFMQWLCDFVSYCWKHRQGKGWEGATQMPWCAECMRENPADYDAACDERLRLDRGDYES